jgi:hypothetical protein
MNKSLDLNDNFFKLRSINDHNLKKRKIKTDEKKNKKKRKVILKDDILIH